MTTTLATDLRAGDRLRYRDVPVTIVGTPEPATADDSRPYDLFGRSGHVRVMARREDTGESGWILFGPDARIDRLERVDPQWGSPFQDGPAYITEHDGPIWMHRKGRRVRFYDAAGAQIGPEQSNVAPAVAYAHDSRWQPL